MLKKYHVSKNLFDKDDSSLQYSGTNLAASNVWRTSGSGLVFRIPCQSLTTYTISCDVDTTVWRLSYVESDDIPSSSTSVTTIDVVRNKPTNGVYTFTTTANTKYILFQIGTNSLDDALDVLMLNTGSTAEPYEPYGNTWTEIPYRLYATETDTLTSLPEDIIADGSNAEVLIKGNMQQTGTPSPSSIITPDETGERTGNILQNVLSSMELNGVTITVNADKSITVNGGLTSGGNTYVTVGTLAFESGEKYTIDGVSGYTASTLQLFTQSSSAFAVGNRLQSYNGYVTRTAAASETCDIRLYFYPNVIYDNVTVYPQIVKGDIKPYEPYGFKLTIESGETTTPVYLSEPIRKIGEYADEVGETKNLFDKDNVDLYSGTSLSRLNEWYYAGGQATTIRIPCKPSTTYTLKITASDTVFRVSTVATDIVPLEGDNPIQAITVINSGSISEYTFTTSSDAKYILFQGSYAVINTILNTLMLNEGSTALPYQPYGNAVTRPIRKLVLTGQEEWYKPATTTNAYRITLDGYMREMVNVPVCTHYSGIAPVDGTARLNNLDTAFLLSSSGNNYFYIRDDDYTSAADFKSYLQQQYAAGTPVCVWYVLEEPTSEAITMPTIPTTAGSQTFDVNTSLKPSEVQLTYKGWHKHSPKEYNNGSWT